MKSLAKPTLITTFAPAKVKRKVTMLSAAAMQSKLLERWQSGRMHRSWKPAYWEVPGVRIPLSPLAYADACKCLFIHATTYLTPHGEMAEWSNAPVLKTGVLRGTGGSNPSLSAIKEVKIDFLFFVYLTTKRVVYQGKSIYLHMNIIYKQRTIKHATCVVRFGDRASYGINGRYFL